MGWDPKVAITIYQPIDFYAKAAEAAAKQHDSEKLSLGKFKKKLNFEFKEQGFWHGREITEINSETSDRNDTAAKIQDSKEIKASIQIVEKSFSNEIVGERYSSIIKGFERKVSFRN